MKRVPKGQAGGGQFAPDPSTSKPRHMAPIGSPGRAAGSVLVDPTGTPDRSPASLHRHIAASTDPELLTYCATSINPDTREAVAANPSTPPPALWALARDKNPLVREAAAANPRLHSVDWMAGRSADNQPTVPRLWCGLARDKNPDVRRALAANPDLDADIAQFLAEDRDEWVRQQACDHPAYTGDRDAWQWTTGQKIRALFRRR